MITEIFVQPVSHSKNAPQFPNIFTEKEYFAVFFHCGSQCLVKGFGDGQLGCHDCTPESAKPSW